MGDVWVSKTLWAGTFNVAYLHRRLKCAIRG